MAPRTAEPAGSLPPRPIPESYWLAPGRLLVGEYPGSQSRADAMERLRRFLQSGVTCFVDLTEPRELPSYEALLPFATPEGRRVEYLREPIPDHGVPQGIEVMQRVLAMIDDALEAGHVVYVHCRAGLGRSAMVAGCWLAGRHALGSDALEELQRCFQQSAKSQYWSEVPETAEQAEYVRNWVAGGSGRVAVRPGGKLDLETRARGALLGMAAGDATGAAAAARSESGGLWTQHTSLTLCVAESLLEHGRLDARDQIDRFVRWQRDGHLSATGRPGEPTPDVAKALANYQWRGQPMAGSHDPRDRTTAALPRAVAAVLFASRDAEAAVQIAGECARTTHQSPLVLDTCRYFAAVLTGAIAGEQPDRVLGALYEPVPGLWARHALKPAVVSMAQSGAPPPLTDVPPRRAPAPDVVAAFARARAAAAKAAGFEEAIRVACESAVEPALEAAVAGALLGAIVGPDGIPRERIASLARVDLLESFALRLARAGQGGAA
jgi:ADP-ribosylglycohydrolase/protein-tyrosine phosphatase